MFKEVTLVKRFENRNIVVTKVLGLETHVDIKLVPGKNKTIQVNKKYINLLHYHHLH